MEFSAQQIAEFFKGEIVGDPDVIVSNLSRIEEGTPGTITFLANAKYSHYIYDTQASIVLVNKDFVPDRAVQATMIKVDNAYESLAKLLQMVEAFKPKKQGISPLAYIAESAKVGENAYIAPFAYIGENAQIGDNCAIYPHVFIGDNTRIGNGCNLFAGVKVHFDTVIGNDCTLQAGAVIGSDGFGFSPTASGVYEKIPQIGNVVIEDNVEIQANTVVDRASIGSTIIRKGVKLDNLVQIAHNVEVGENTVIASQTGVAGSSKIGKQCIIAGQVGLAGHIQIADGSILGAQSGVSNTIKQKGIYQGYPAIPLRDFHRSSIVYKNLAELQRTVYALQKQVAELTKAKN